MLEKKKSLKTNKQINKQKYIKKKKKLQLDEGSRKKGINSGQIQMLFT